MTSHKRRLFTFLLCAALATAVTTAAAAAPVAAETWPARSIRFINPFPAGGGLDAFARPLAARVSERLGQQIVIENLSGAGGTVGAATASKTAPDGYTFLLGAVHHVIAESIYPKLSYSLERDFIPVTVFATIPNVIIVHPRHNFQNLAHLIAYSKANPDKLSYASAGNGTSHHLAAELFKSMTGASMSHIPYRGAAPALQDVIAGQVDVMFDGLTLSTPHIKAGKVRALAVTGKTRSASFPQLPTVAEAGVAGYEVTTWYALWARRGTPDAVVMKMHIEIAKALAEPDMTAMWAAQGAEPLLLDPGQFAVFQKAEFAKWAQVVKASGAKLE